MTLLTGAVVILVVWAVSLVRAVRLRALIYSLPLPITLVLLTTHIRVGPQQLVGVVLLNVFVATVAWAHQRLRWHILLADLAGITVYIAGSSVLVHAGRLPFAPVLAIAAGFWAGLVALPARVGRHAPAPSRHPQALAAPGRPALPSAGKLFVIAGGALVTVWLGQLLQGMVVTFPYSGVLVVVEARRDLAEFRVHFARNSLALLGFFTAYYFIQDTSRYLAIAAGWAAFLSGALLLHLVSARTRDHTPDPPHPSSSADRWSAG